MVVLIGHFSEQRTDLRDEKNIPLKRLFIQISQKHTWAHLSDVPLAFRISADLSFFSKDESVNTNPVRSFKISALLISSSILTNFGPPVYDEMMSRLRSGLSKNRDDDTNVSQFARDRRRVKKKISTPRVMGRQEVYFGSVARGRKNEMSLQPFILF